MIKKRVKHILITLILLSILLIGCTPNYVPEDYEKETISKGDEIIRDYLSKENISYESDDTSLVTGTAVGGSYGEYPTDYVKGIYKSGKYKHAQKMKLKKFDNKMISVYIDDNLDFDEEGFPVGSDISIQIKY